MTLLQEIRSVSGGLDTPELLRYLVEERFSGRTVVTASLMASSIVVLKLISEIDPATPIIFCHRQPVFDESIEYRARIVELLGLKRYSISDGQETSVRPGDSDHCERMWVYYRDMPGRSLQLLHLNDCLAPYDCWINAIYQTPRPSTVRHRVDVDGRLMKIDPLLRWTKDDVRAFMRAHGLPYHKLARRTYDYGGEREAAAFPSYHF